MVSSATSSFPAVAGPSSAAAMAALYNTDNSARAVNVCLPSKIDAFPSGAVAIFSCLPKIIGRFKMLTPNRPLLKSFFSSAVRFGSTSRHPLAFPKETSSIFMRTLSWTTLGAITFITFGFFPSPQPQQPPWQNKACWQGRGTEQKLLRTKLYRSSPAEGP